MESFFEWTWKSFDGIGMYSHSWAPKGKSKAVVCLVHGLGEHTGRYEHVAAALNEKGYVLAGFDLRGHGRSGGPRGHVPSAEACLNDIDMFLAQVEQHYPGKPRFLYGHSIGAIFVMAYTPLRKPKIAGVIATALSTHSALAENKLKVFLTRSLGSILPTIYVPSGLDPKTLSHNPEVVNAYITDPLVHSHATLGFGKSALDLIQQVNKNAPNFPVPVLLMHGTKDTLGYVISSQEVAKLIPEHLVTLRLWEGLFHEIHNEPEQAQVFKVITDWLDGHLPK